MTQNPDAIPAKTFLKYPKVSTYDASTLVREKRSENLETYQNRQYSL